VEREFLNLDEREQGVRSVMAKMESGFIRRMVISQWLTNPQKALEAKAAAQSGGRFEGGAQAKGAAHVTRTGVWFGLGMMGLIGWSVAVPTLLGAALGLWLDSRHPRKPFLDAGAAGGRPRDRLFECVALGGQGRQGHAGRTGGWR
jgi:predicted F0F1-ATPase subunit